MPKNMKRRSMLILFELAVWLIGCININIIGVTEITNKLTVDSMIMIIVGFVLNKMILDNIDNIVNANRKYPRILLIATLLVMVTSICTDATAIIYGGGFNRGLIIFGADIIVGIIILVYIIKIKPYVEMKLIEPYGKMIDDLLERLEGFMNKYEKDQNDEE